MTNFVVHVNWTVTHKSRATFLFYRSSKRQSRSLFDVLGFETLRERARDVVEIWNPPGGRPDVDVIRRRFTLDVSRRRKRKKEFQVFRNISRLFDIAYLVKK